MTARSNSRSRPASTLGSPRLPARPRRVRRCGHGSPPWSPSAHPAPTPPRDPESLCYLDADVRPSAEHRIDLPQPPLDSGFEARAVSPYPEMGAYDVLLCDPQATFTSLPKRSDQHPGSVPSDFVPREEAVASAAFVRQRSAASSTSEYPQQVAGRGTSDRASPLPGLLGPRRLPLCSSGRDPQALAARTDPQRGASRANSSTKASPSCPDSPPASTARPPRRPSTIAAGLAHHRAGTARDAIAVSVPDPSIPRPARPRGSCGARGAAAPTSGRGIQSP